MEKIKVAFVCTHNSCRSQIAEALASNFHSDFFEAYSGGTETKDKINQDAVRIMKERFSIDMETSQSSKLVDYLPVVDVVITMGCNVNCPFLPCSFREDWGLEDPTGLPDKAFHHTIDLIESKIKGLRFRIESGEITIPKRS
ncbi:MAG: arsenate reductase ArsC [Firmicutes bacterium]|nr:arsenate reductase ArsC [Bacillota bacterium]